MEISIPGLEQAAAGGWRAPEEARLGGWLLRAAGGFTGRGNSALAIGDPGLPLAAAIDQVCRWYQARGLPPMVAVPFPLGQPQRTGIDRFLSERGWPIRSGPATVMTAVPGTVARSAAPALAVPGQAGAASAGVDMAAEPDRGWLAFYHYRGQRPPPISRRLLMSAPWQVFASVREAGEVLAIGRMAVSGEWAGLTAFEVRPSHRRRGLATGIIAALAALARDRGIPGIYLQVADDNAPARSLYHRAGFADHHGYHYRVAP
jgi:GNAT superfamily N-acetyltransferase